MKIVYPIRIKYSMHGYIAYCETMGISAYGPSIDLVIKHITKGIKQEFFLAKIKGLEYTPIEPRATTTLLIGGFNSRIVIDTEEFPE